MPVVSDMRDVEVIAPNFKRRLSGVTSTIIQLVPVQNRLGQKVVTIGPGLPTSLPAMRWRDLLALWHAPTQKPFRIWHARRNLEMLPGIVLRDLLRMKLKVIFTSASQRHHTGWTKFLVSRMDAVIATSEKTAAYLDVPSTVVMHGIDPVRFSPPMDKVGAKTVLGIDPAQNYVGCFGRVRHQKGTDLFVDTMIRLLPSRPRWSAIVAGRATADHVDFENGLKDKVRAAGLSDRILFVGEHTNINDWYRALDLFVAPQRWEGFGLTPLEAMASGVPVIASDVGAFSEVIASGENETGTLIVADDLSAMQTATAVFMDDDARRIAAGTNGRKRAATHFTIEGEARSVASVYATTAQDKRLDTLVIGKDTKFGLTKDIELLLATLAETGIGGRTASAGIRSRSWMERVFRIRRARLAIHNERIFPRWFSAADIHMVIPNQERFPRRHLRRLKKIDLVLAKTHHAEEIFRSLGVPTTYLGFTSEDRLDLSVPRDWNSFLHIAGGSTLKGTEDILALWEKHPEWPDLTLVQKEHLAPKSVPTNVTLISGYLEDDKLKQLQNGIGIHLCPSRAEGWGHHLVESLSAGALVISTDAPPMNELVTTENGLPVASNRSEPRHLGTCFFVSTTELEKAVLTAIQLTEPEKMQFGSAARKSYERIQANFRTRVRSIFGEYTPNETD